MCVSATAVFLVPGPACPAVCVPCAGASRTPVRAASRCLPRPRRGRHLALSWRVVRRAPFVAAGWAVVVVVAAASAAGAASGFPPSGVWGCGADDETRTRDPHPGKVMPTSAGDSRRERHHTSATRHRRGAHITIGPARPTRSARTGDMWRGAAKRPQRCVRLGLPCRLGRPVVISSAGAARAGHRPDAESPSGSDVMRIPLGDV